MKLLCEIRGQYGKDAIDIDQEELSHSDPVPPTSTQQCRSQRIGTRKAHTNELEYSLSRKVIQFLSPLESVLLLSLRRAACSPEETKDLNNSVKGASEPIGCSIWAL